MTTPVLILEKTLVSSPEIQEVTGVRIQTYREGMESDWAKLHADAFADSPIPFRTLTAIDFLKAFVERPNWNPNWMWFAVNESDASVVGAVYLTVISPNKRAEDQVGIIHWLMVAPSWRTHGVGELLLLTLEAACWNESNARTVRAECHVEWKEAVAFYQSHGYQITHPGS